MARIGILNIIYIPFFNPGMQDDIDPLSHLKLFLYVLNSSRNTKEVESPDGIFKYANKRSLKCNEVQSELGHR